MTDQNGLVFQQRRFSRAYDQPIVQNTSKGMVVRPDAQNTMHSSQFTGATATDPWRSGMEALGGLTAKMTLGSLALAGALVTVCGKDSLQFVSQLFGFMLMLVVAFLACVGCFYWWSGCCRKNIVLSVKKVAVIYLLCIISDALARLISVFTAVPPSSSIPTDASYFISLATILLFVFSLLVHREGLKAMFSRESVLFVVCMLVLNFSIARLFEDFLPHFLLPQVIHVGLLLGLSLSLAGYKFPNISPSGIYWMLNQSGPMRPIVTAPATDSTQPQVRLSVDTVSQTRRVSNSSTSSMKHRASVSSLSSFTSTVPQVCMCNYR